MTALEGEGSERGGKEVWRTLPPFWYVKNTGKGVSWTEISRGGWAVLSGHDTLWGRIVWVTALQTGHLCVVVVIDGSLDSILKVMGKYRRDH